MTEELPTVQPMPGVIVPQYAPGLKIETSRDIMTMTTRYHLSLHLERAVDLADDYAVGSREQEAVREVVARGVRSMQEEAVTALGLQHWREEIRRELHAEELRERKRVLLAVRDAVRRADSMAEAALLIQDEIDALEVR